MQQIILLAFLDKQYGDPFMVRGIGIAYTQIFLVFYPLFFAINVVYTVLGGNDFGAKKHYLFGLQMNRTKFYSYLITIAVGILHISINCRYVTL